MNSQLLSNRDRQPGHDRTFTASEQIFLQIARRSLCADEYEVVEQPRDLAAIFVDPSGRQRSLGVVPEAAIINRATQRRFFVEVKKQGNAGNAEERAAKHHTVQFYKTLHEKYRYAFHPFVTIMCEALAANPRYTVKFAYLYEPKNYFLWLDYNAEMLGAFLRERCREWLAPS